MPLVQVTRTYLEMTSPHDLVPVEDLPQGVRVERVANCPIAFFRYLYAEVGREYLWRDRLAWTEGEIEAYLGGPVELWVLYREGAPAGYFELRGHDDRSMEVAYFGLMPHAIGRGLGKFLLSRAVEAAWAHLPSRVWLHTCTLDHPNALSNYLKRGFREVRREEYQAEVP
jgi:GNAT superfamily N-acetyltransferase